jgi:hypothetical protein
MVTSDRRPDQLLSSEQWNRFAWVPTTDHHMRCSALTQTTRPAMGHIHVLAVETRDPDGGQTRWTTRQVIAALRDGERFVVSEDDQGRETLLRRWCAQAVRR